MLGLRDPVWGIEAIEGEVTTQGRPRAGGRPVAGVKRRQWDAGAGQGRKDTEEEGDEKRWGPQSLVPRVLAKLGIKESEGLKDSPPSQYLSPLPPPFCSGHCLLHLEVVPSPATPLLSPLCHTSQPSSCLVEMAIGSLFSFPSPRPALQGTAAAIFPRCSRSWPRPYTCAE